MRTSHIGGFILLTITFILLSAPYNQCEAQKLEISNGETTIDLMGKKFFEIQLCRTPENPNDCSKGAYLMGNLVKTTNDSLHFLAFKHNSYVKNQQGIKISHNYESDEAKIPIVIPKHSSMAITAYKSRKEYKRLKIISGLGAGIAVVGVLTAVNALFVPSKSTKRTMAIAGGTMFIGGLVIGVSSQKKQHCLCDSCGSWRFQ